MGRRLFCATRPYAHHFFRQPKVAVLRGLFTVIIRPDKVSKPTNFASQDNVCDIKPWSYHRASCADIKLVGYPGQFRILDFRFRIELVRETIRNPQSEIRNKSYAAKHG